VEQIGNHFVKVVWT